MRTLAFALAAFVSLLAGTPAVAKDSESALLRKVDRSFSSIAFGTPFRLVRSRLRKVVVDDCEATQSCFWRDTRGIRHFFWGPVGDKLLTVKFIDAHDFAGRSISAFGIGRARMRVDVLDRIGRFDRAITSDCELERTRPPGPDQCGLGIGQGWAVLHFDEADRLSTIRLVVAEHY